MLSNGVTIMVGRARNASPRRCPTPRSSKNVAKITEIRVDPDTVVKYFSKNLRNEGSLYTQRSFQVLQIRLEDPCTIAVGVDPRTDGARYSDEPHPVWVEPSQFVQGWSHDEQQTNSEAAGIGLPREAENKRVLRRGGLEEGTKAFEEAHRTAMQDWKVLWDKAVRNDLKDEITFYFGDRNPYVATFEHTVPVTYVSNGE